MKKSFMLLTLMVAAALALSACAGGSGQDTTPVPGATEPGVGIETAPALETPAVVETPAVETPAVEPTATVEMMETPAVVETPLDETPGVPVTGNDDCNPHRLDNLLDMDIVDATGRQVAEVDGVIVFRDARGVSTDTGAMETPAVGETPAMDEPPAGDDSAMQTTPAGGDAAAAVTDAAAPRIAYLILDIEDADEDVVVPFSAFDLSAVQDGAGAMDGSEQPAATEPAGAVAETPAGTPAATDNMPGGNVVDDDDCLLPFTGSVTAGALTNAPTWTDDIDISVDGWDEQFRAYWSGQGVTFNDADFANLGSPVLLDDDFGSIDTRSAGGADLGEVEDFILNPETGEFTYALLETGGFLGIGERVVPVPTNVINWVSEDAGDLTDVGHLVINVPDDQWENAPSFEDRDQIDTTVAGWDEEIQAFWNNLSGGSDTTE